jgi:hypothetical protein
MAERAKILLIEDIRDIPKPAPEKIVNHQKVILKVVEKLKDEGQIG